MLDFEALCAKLNDPSLLALKGYINGEWVDADNNKTFELVNPATGRVIAELADQGANETKRAIAAADASQKAWANKTAKERANILKAWHSELMANQEDLATLITAEMGKPFAEAMGEIAYGASFIEWFAEEGKRLYGETIPGHQGDKRIVVLKQPIGVVGAITPWNFPNAMITRKVAPALAAGCTAVIKPAEQSPLSATALAVLGERAGIPAGVFNIIVGMDGPAIGQELCANDLVKKITFTGSTEVGRILMRQSADTIKKVSLELGGNAPFIVFDDANIDAAVEGAMISKYRNAGQTCVCANRIYVQAGVYDAFVEKLKVKVEALSVGEGFGEGVTTGPLIDEQGFSKVKEHVEDALDKGAKLITGGQPHDLGGLFFEPTILANVDKSMKMAHEETFGPIAPIFKFETDDDVIAQANDTEFGLAAYFYANNLSRVWAVAEALDYGMVGINTGLISTEVAPFGGVKQSGLGREGSHHGMEDFVELKYLCLSI